MSVKQNKAILQRAAEAFNDRAGRSGWFEIHDPSVVAYGLAPQPLDLAGLKQFYSALWTGFPDLHITIENLIGEDETVAWRLSARGKHAADFLGIPATGKEVTFEAQYIFQFQNGKIVRRWTNLDRLGVLTQLGAIPAPV